MTGGKEKGGVGVGGRGQAEAWCPTYNREHERAQKVPQRGPGDGRDRRHLALETHTHTLSPCAAASGPAPRSLRTGTNREDFSVHATSFYGSKVELSVALPVRQRLPLTSYHLVKWNIRPVNPLPVWKDL